MPARKDGLVECLRLYFINSEDSKFRLLEPSADETEILSLNKLLQPQLVLFILIFASIISLIFIFQIKDLEPPGKRNNGLRRNFSQATHRKLTHSGKAYEGAIAPDGNSFAFVEKDSNSSPIVYVQNIEDETPNLLFPVEPQTQIQFYKSGSLRWSWDGTLIYFLTTSFGKVYLHLISRFGEDRRIIGGDSYSLLGSMCSLSPDNKTIVSSFQNYHSVDLYHLSDGIVETIFLHWEFDWIEFLEWSPDGEFFIVVTSNNDIYSITEINVHTGISKNIKTDSSEISSPRFVQNGKTIWYKRGKGTNCDLVEINYDYRGGSIKSSEIVHFKGEIPNSISFSRDGSKILFGKGVNYSNLWISPLCGRDSLVQFTQLTFGTSLLTSPNFSPEGHLIAYIRSKNESSDIYTYDYIEKVSRKLTTDIKLLDALAWSPTGDKIAFIKRDGLNINIATLTMNSGFVKTYYGTNPGFNAQLYWEPDSLILYQLPEEYYEGFNYNFLHPGSERERKLLKKGPFGYLSWPVINRIEGKIAGYCNTSEGGGLWVFDIEIKNFSRILAGEIYPIKWSEDSKMVYAIDCSYSPWKILKVDPIKKSIEKMNILPISPIPEYDLIDISPNDSLIVINVPESISDLWLFNMDEK